MVVSRVWNKLSVKLEVRDAAAIGTVVKSGVVVEARMFGEQLTMFAGGRGVQRGPAPAKGSAPIGRTVTGGVVCYGCGKTGHLWRDCHAGGGTGAGGHLLLRCWGCGGVGHGISFCPERALPVTDAAGVPVPAVGSGAGIVGVKRGGGPLAGAGFRGRSYGGGSVLGYLGGGARRVAAAPRSARA